MDARSFEPRGDLEAGGANSDEKPLQSWKEIAAYLERDERTARRWEKEEGLPVRRHRADRRSSVYAYPSELSAWRKARSPKENETRPGWLSPYRVAAASAGILAAVLIALTVKYGPVLNPPNPLVEASDGITIRQVWSGPEVDFSGRPSPDGRYLSHGLWPTGDVAIRDLGSEETRRLTKDASWTAMTGFSLFSPDGRQVAYEWGMYYSELRLTTLDGSETRVLYRAQPDWWIVPCDWSPDGRHILIRYYTDQRKPSQIGTIAVADGSLRVVKTLDAGQPANTRNMWFSADGRYIVYDVLPPNAQTKRDLAIISADGALEFPLVENPADDYALGWSPDGRSIIFASDRSGAYGVWAIPVSEGKPAGEAHLVKRDIGPIRPLGFTRDGTLYYYQAGSMTTWDHDVYSVEVDLDQGTMGEPRLEAQRFRGLNMLPEWSPDGRYLAYVSGRPDSKAYVISIRNEETGEESEIHPGLASFDYIRWAPDGQSFLAAGQDMEKRGGLFLIDAQTGDVKPLLDGDQITGALLFAQWFPDGRRILYGLNSRQPEILAKIRVRNLKTGSEEEILRISNHLIGSIALSPDGSRLAFADWRLQGGAPRNATLALMPASGGPATELLRVEFPEMLANLTWSNDSRSVLFARARQGERETREGIRPLWQIPATGGEPRRIGALQDQGQINILSLHPDGRRLAYTRSSKAFEIWAMGGLLSEAPQE